MKNTQIEKDIKNVFFDMGAMILSVICMIVVSLKTILGFAKTQKLNKKSKIFTLLNYIVLDWPRNFIKQPSGYKLGRYLGDMIQHVFLKK